MKIELNRLRESSSSRAENPSGPMMMVHGCRSREAPELRALEGVAESAAFLDAVHLLAAGLDSLEDCQEALNVTAPYAGLRISCP